MPNHQLQLENLVCQDCDGVIAEEESYVGFHDECVDDNTWSCESCGDVYLDGDASRAMESASGIDRHYSTITQDGCATCDDCLWICGSCGTYWADEESYHGCCDDSNAVHQYSYKPSYVYYDDAGSSMAAKPGVLYMGIELEMVRVANCAEWFLETANEDASDPNFFYFKEDGSVGYDGAELVTMPATLDRFMEKFPFETLDLARRYHRVRSFEYDSCGFHIHVSRAAFSDTHLWRFVRFQLKNPSMCQFVAQRGSVSYATWQMEQSENDSIPKWVKGKGSNNRRYLAINFQNRHTIELRYFKGNILKDAIVKNLEFVHSMYEYTKHMSYADVLLGAMSEDAYMKWLNAQPGYDSLKKYLASNNVDANKEN